MSRLAFLTYMSRSGSTLLARMLDEYEPIRVTLEARLPDGILYPRVSIRDAGDVARALDVMFSDGKFRQWGVDRARLAEVLGSARFPVDADGLLRSVLGAAFGDPPPEVVVCKFGYYVEHVEAVRATYPDAQMIFMMRDPRAVHSSQKRSVNSETRTPMSTNPARTARQFVKLEQVVSRWAGAPWFYLLRYEDLLARPDEELARLVAFLGLPDARRAATGDRYDERIPEAERHLHPLVGGDVQRQRAEAWRRELSPAEILTIDRAAGEAMARHGYAPASADRPPAGDRLRRAGYRLRYAAWRVARRGYRAALAAWPGGGHFKKRSLGT